MSTNAPRGLAMIVVLLGLFVHDHHLPFRSGLIAVQRQSVELQARQIQAGWLESAVAGLRTAFRRSEVPR